MHQDAIDIFNLADNLLRAHEFYVQRDLSPTDLHDQVMLYREDAKDIYACFVDYEQRILKLQELFKREIASTGKRYGVRNSGVMDHQALLDAVEIIRNKREHANEGKR